MKRCVFLLVYFGSFNEYFPFFLKTCAFNNEYDWLIITDNQVDYSYPSNCFKVNMTLKEFNVLASIKLGMNIEIIKPYKLCDFKPAFGLIFEDYIKEYMYWGHCDCDLIFGDLNKFLTKLFENEYDKIFAAGHLTLYKNTKDNNKLFMSEFDGIKIYKDVYVSDEIFVFDEDYNTNKNFRINIHTIFINKNMKIFDEDFSLNPKINSAEFINMVYSREDRNFIAKKNIDARYYWDKGKIYSINNNGNKREYLYAHFQMRKMRFNQKELKEEIIEILPDRFLARKKILNKKRIKLSYLFWYDYYTKKIVNKLKKIRRNCRAKNFE